MLPEKDLLIIFIKNYKNFFSKDNYNILNFERNIKDLIINIIFYLSSSAEPNLIVYLLNAIIIIDKLQNDLKAYKSKNFNENIINNNNDNENNINNNIKNENENFIKINEEE